MYNELIAMSPTGETFITCDMFDQYWLHISGETSSIGVGVVKPLRKKYDLIPIGCDFASWDELEHYLKIVGETTIKDS